MTKTPLFGFTVVLASAREVFGVPCKHAAPNTKRAKSVRMTTVETHGDKMSELSTMHPQEDRVRTTRHRRQMLNISDLIGEEMVRHSSATHCDAKSHRIARHDTTMQDVGVNSAPYMVEHSRRRSPHPSCGETVV